MSNEKAPILMTEQFWGTSQLSVARLTGRVRIWGHEYSIFDRFGRTLFEASIPAGASADLVRNDFIPQYRRLGREKFLDLLNQYPHKTDKEFMEFLKAYKVEKREIEEGSLFK